MKMLESLKSGTVLRMTALAIALVFCLGMFAPMASVAAPSVAPMTEAKVPENYAMAAPQTDPPTVLAAPEPAAPDTIVIQPNAIG